MNDKIHMALIYGSLREGRCCDTVANRAAAQIAWRDTRLAAPHEQVTA